MYSIDISNKTPAQILYESGYNLIPLGTDKKPVIEWKAYQTERVAAWQFDQWAHPLPRMDETSEQMIAVSADFALLTGPIPYSDAIPIVCLDADDEEAIDLVRSHCPETPVQQVTGSRRGRHFIYRRPSLIDMPYLPQRIKTSIEGKVYNLDIKADCNYIVCPGAGHKSGNRYEWVTPWTKELESLHDRALGR